MADRLLLGHLHKSTAVLSFLLTTDLLMDIPDFESTFRATHHAENRAQPAPLVEARDGDKTAWRDSQVRFCEQPRSELQTIGFSIQS